jgi:hypothetical protein
MRSPERLPKIDVPEVAITTAESQAYQNDLRRFSIHNLCILMTHSRDSMTHHYIYF